MKRFPEKTVMAAIILSCGFVMNADPSAQRAKAKRLGSEAPKVSVAAQTPVGHPARAAKALALRDDLVTEGRPVLIGQLP